MMTRKLSGLLLLASFSLPGAACAQTAQASAPSSASRKAKVNCHGRSDVPMTADAEQALPLKLVAVLKCGDQVTILSDTQGYTMLVQTSSGERGYVTRVNLSPTIQATENPAPTRAEAPAEGGAEKLLAYVTDAKSWQEEGGFKGPGVMGYSGDPNSQVAEFIKNFTQLCPAVTLTDDKTKASYIVLPASRGSKKGLGWVEHSLSHKADKIEVFRSEGDAVLSQPAPNLEEAAKLACAAIQKDAAQPPATPPATPVPQP